jgi:hypothetical protein
MYLYSTKKGAMKGQGVSPFPLKIASSNLSKFDDLLRIISINPYSQQQDKKDSG